MLVLNEKHFNCNFKIILTKEKNRLPKKELIEAIVQ